MDPLDENEHLRRFKKKTLQELYQKMSPRLISNSMRAFDDCDVLKPLKPLDYRTLRLRGGVAFEEKEEEVKNPLKSPFQECKFIMEQFDQILAAYKSSLGPCGEATCPYSQSMMQDTCRKKCRAGKPIEEKPPEEECEGDPCDNQECPYREKRRFEAGCGFSECAYAKFKHGLVDQDASLQLMMLPPAVSGRCGSPNCDYPLTPDLPPIHWDCPDPLPKGACKNPNCPLQPPDLKRIKVPDKKKLCSCQDCPYAFPPPCGLPSCPFRENPCPFLGKHKEKDECSCSSNAQEEQSEDDCSNPNCPFAPDNRGASKTNEQKFKGEFTACDNPNCPFAQPSTKRRSTQDKKGSVFSSNGKARRSSKQQKEFCGNPECIYASDRNQSYDYSCPFLEEKEKKNSDCPECPNPNCPFMKKKKIIPAKRKDDNCDSNNFCGNPNCSYHNRRSLDQDSEECMKPGADCDEAQETCDNPDCPYRKDRRGTADEESICYYADENENENPKQSSIKPGSLTVENKIIINNAPTNNNAGGDTTETSNKPQENKPRTKKKRGKFVYSMGNVYPGVKIGHRECVTQVFNVPPKMGWLWNIPPPIERLKPRRGWKPGALTKSIAARIRAHRQAKGLGMLRVPKFTESRDLDADQYTTRDIKITPKPTLHIQKKEGTYSIVMNPLKDPKSLVDNEDPYMECTPMRFKISPSKNKKTGSETCFCDENEQGNSSSSESELDIEFTPPAGIIHPERFKRKINVIHCDTQYNPQDCQPTKEENKKPQKSGKEKKGKEGKGGKGEKKGGKGKKGKKGK